MVDIYSTSDSLCPSSEHNCDCKYWFAYPWGLAFYVSKYKICQQPMESQKMPSTSPLQRWGRGWNLGGWSRQRFSYNLPTTQHNYRPINAAVEKNGAQYISQIVRQRSDPGRGIWLVYQLNIWPRGKKCEENIPRQNNWDRIKGCDGSKWPRGAFCVGILPIFASRPFLQSVDCGGKQFGRQHQTKYCPLVKSLV